MSVGWAASHLASKALYQCLSCSLKDHCPKYPPALHFKDLGLYVILIFLVGLFLCLPFLFVDIMYQQICNQSIEEITAEGVEPFIMSPVTGDSARPHFSAIPTSHNKTRLSVFLAYMAVFTAWALSLFVVAYLSDHKCEQYTFAKGYETDLGQN